MNFEIQMIYDFEIQIGKVPRKDFFFLLVTFSPFLCSSFIDISGSALSKSQADDGIAAMLQAAGLYNKDWFSWEDFHFLLRDHSVQLNIKGEGYTFRYALISHLSLEFLVHPTQRHLSLKLLCMYSQAWKYLVRKNYPDNIKCLLLRKIGK